MAVGQNESDRTIAFPRIPFPPVNIKTILEELQCGGEVRSTGCLKADLGITGTHIIHRIVEVCAGTEGNNAQSDIQNCGLTLIHRHEQIDNGVIEHVNRTFTSSGGDPHRP